MQASAQLKELLHSINRKSYPAYKSLRGAYQFDRYILSIDHVQGDPFASPSHISVKLSHRDTGFPAEYYKDSLTRITLGDFLNRQFEQQVNRYTFRAKGSGKSGLISVSHCGQEVLARTAAKSAKTESTPDFLSASLQTAAPSMPLSWKKSSLNFFRSVSARHSFIPARTPVT